MTNNPPAFLQDTETNNIMLKIWVLAKEKLTKEEIKNEILLRTDNDGSTAWHLAAFMGEQDIMKKICDWVKE
jgi:hypothetical protein